MAQRVYLKKSAVVNKQPTPSNLEFGELVINYASGSGKSFLATKKYDGSIAVFPEKTYMDAAYADSSLASDVQTIGDKVDTLSGSVITLSAAVKTQLSTVYKYKGTKATYAQLPSTGNEKGDVWNVEAANGNTPAGTNYAWDGSAWDALGGTVDLSGYLTKASAGTMYDNVSNIAEGAVTKANSAFTYASAISATVTTNYATKTLVSSTSAATWGSAKTYADATFLTKASAGTMYDNLNSSIEDISELMDDFALSATVGELMTIVEEDELVTAASLNDLNSKIASLSGDLSTTYLTKASAGTMYDDLSSVATGAAEKANSAFTYASAISATVTSNYATKALVASTSAATWGSAKTYGDATYLTKASAGTMYDNLNSAIGGITDKANSAFTYASAISATVTSNYATKALVSSTSAATWGSAKTYGDATFLTKASAGTMYDNLSNIAEGATTKANSAFTYASAISATVTNNYATKALVSTTSAATWGSAKTYGDATYLTKVSAGTMYDNVSNIAEGAVTKANSAFTYASAISATVTSNYATKALVSSTSAATWGSAKTYGDATFLTKASAGTMYDNLSNIADGALTKANSAFTYASAISATVTSNYATKALVSTTSAATWGSAKTYGDATFLTKASAGTMYSNVTSSIQTAENKADSAFTYASAISATVTNNYATKALVATTSAATWGSAKTYGDATFLTKASAGTMYSNITSEIENINNAIGNFALSATVDGIFDIIEEDEEIWAHAANDLNDKIASVSGDLVTNYLTRASAGTMYDNLSNAIDGAVTKANSAFTYASAISATVTSFQNVFATKALVASTSAATWGSAKTYGDATFLTKASAGTMYDNLSSVATGAVEKANSAFTYASAISATVTSNYATKSLVSTTSAATWGSAKTYGDATFLTKASAGTMYSNVTSSIQTAENKANSAFTYASAISATVTSDYATKTLVASTSAATWGSAKTYGDATFLTRASAGTMYSNLTSAINNEHTSAITLSGSVVALSGAVISKISTLFDYKGSVAACSNLPANPKTGDTYNVVAASGNTPAGTNWTWDGSKWDPLGGTVDLSGYLTKASAGTMYSNVTSSIQAVSGGVLDLSGSVINNYATEAKASAYAAAALGNAMDYTDSKISGLSIGNYLTRASAGTMYNNLTSAVQTAENKANSAFTYASAISATVTNNYATKALVSTTSAATWGSAKTYGDATFLTKVSAGTMYSNLTSSVQTATSKANSAFTYASAISATVTSSYATKALVSTTSAATWGSAKTYGDATFLTKASAGTMYSNVTSNINTLSGSLVDLSASVITNYATEAEASEYAAAALGNAMAYTDSKIGDLAIDDYLTRASAGTMYSNLTSLIQTAENKANSAFTYASAISATVTNNYATKALVATTSAATWGSAKTYGDATFLTKASAGTMYNNVTAMVDSLSGGVMTEIQDIYDTIEENEKVTSASLNDLNSRLANISMSMTQIDGNYLSMASAGTMWDDLTEAMEDYALSGSVTTIKTNLENTISENEAVTSTALAYLNGKVVSAVSYTTGATTASITGNTITIPKPKVLTITKNGTSIGTYDGTAAVTAATTDAAVKQSVATGNYYRGLLLSAPYTSTATAGPTATTTGETYINAGIYANPSTGKIYAKGFALTATSTNLLTADGGSVAQSTFVQKTGDTMTGPLTLKGEQYSGNFGLDANNSDIIRVNSIRTADAADDATEGLMFYRDATHFDSVWAKTGNLYFSPNVTSAATSTGYTVYHSGNFTPSNYASATNEAKVKQENVATANYRPLLFSSNENAAQASIPTTTVTGQTYFNKEIYAQPSTGELGATRMKVGGHVTLQYNSTTEALDFIFS